MVERNPPVTLTAKAQADYVFSGWKMNGVQVSGGSNQTFVVTEDSHFEAVFTKLEDNTPTHGVIEDTTSSKISKIITTSKDIFGKNAWLFP